MNKKLLKFIRIADGKPYANPQAHEKRVGNWLKQSGFKPNDIKYQPYGNSNPPDWIVKVNGKWIHVECKTSLESRISFNDTPPEKNTLFVFSSKKRNDTMVFYGGDVFKRRVSQLFSDYIRKVKSLERRYIKYCMEFKRTNPYGFVPGFRLRLQQRGGMIMTDFFGPDKRELLVRKAKQRKI